MFNFWKPSVLSYCLFLCSPDDNCGFPIVLQHIDKIMSTHGKQIMQAVTLILEGEHNIEVKEQVCVPPCFFEEYLLSVSTKRNSS